MGKRKSYLSQELSTIDTGFVNFCHAVRISDFNHSDLESMKRSAHLLFKACCLFDQRVTPSLLTPLNVTPVNAEQCLKSCGFCLGYNCMEGRKQKHQKISKYAENTTVQIVGQ